MVPRCALPAGPFYPCPALLCCGVRASCCCFWAVGRTSVYCAPARGGPPGVWRTRCLPGAPASAAGRVRSGPLPRPAVHAAAALAGSAAGQPVLRGVQRWPWRVRGPCRPRLWPPSSAGQRTLVGHFGRPCCAPAKTKRPAAIASWRQRWDTCQAHNGFSTAAVQRCRDAVTTPAIAHGQPTCWPCCWGCGPGACVCDAVPRRPLVCS